MPARILVRDVPDDIHRALKVRAARNGRTLSAVVVSLLRLSVTDRELAQTTPVPEKR